VSKFTLHPLIVFFSNHGCLLSMIILFSRLSYVHGHFMLCYSIIVIGVNLTNCFRCSFQVNKFFVHPVIIFLYSVMGILCLMLQCCNDKSKTHLATFIIFFKQLNSHPPSWFCSFVHVPLLVMVLLC
jgi:hypothetical protein